jgi:hypothetical protein
MNNKKKWIFIGITIYIFNTCGVFDLRKGKLNGDPL